MLTEVGSPAHGPFHAAAAHAPVASPNSHPTHPSPTPGPPHPSLASRLGDDAAWRALEPHFGSKAAADLASRVTDTARGALGSGGAGLGLPQPRLPAGASDALSKLRLPELPAAPSMPSFSLPDSLPHLPSLPSLPSRLSSVAAPDAGALAGALQDRGAAAAAAAGRLPGALSAHADALKALLLSEPGRGAAELGLEPHFGSRAAAAALRELAAALGSALGARGGLPPMLQLPTGAPADGRLAAALSEQLGQLGSQLAAAAGAGAAPESLAAAWASTGHALAGALPEGAAAAAGAGLARAAAPLEALRSALLALPETGAGGLDFGTLCLIAAGALLAVAASVPPADYEASAAASGGGRAGGDPPLSYDYDHQAVAAYFERRPIAVAVRAGELAREAAAFGLALAGDAATGRLRANEAARAAQLRGAIERLGPAYVKVAQVGGGHCWRG
jgi:aarF domain-containing kinase